MVEAADAPDRSRPTDEYCSTAATFAEMPLQSLRNTVGMVPQEPTLFSDTLARNIAFGQDRRVDR